MNDATPARRDSNTGTLVLLASALLLLATLSACGGDDNGGPPPSGARTWHVSPDGSGADCPTPQECLDAAAAGDTIAFADGVYAAVGDTLVDDGLGGRVTAVLVARRSLVLVPESGADVRIDTHFVSGRIGLAIPGNGSTVEVRGLRFDTGSPAIRSAGGTLIAEDCRFFLGEHGIVADGTTLDVRGCTFDEYAGEALVLRDCAGTIADCELTGNNAGGYLAQSRNLRIESTLVAICCLSGLRIEEGGSVTLSGVTVSGTGMVPDDSCGVVVAGGAHATVEKSVIAFNRGVGIDCRTGATVTVSCSDLYSHTSGNYRGCTDATGTAGNIAADPLFCDKPGLDFHLLPESPARASCGVMGAYAGTACEPAPLFVRLRSRPTSR